jgi:hypothetical protein
MLAICFVAMACLATAEDKAAAKPAAKKAGTSDAAYTAKSLSAAPAGIAKEAGVARFDKDGKMSTLRESKNGFTCFVMIGDSMCADANSMAFFDAMMNKKDPPDKLGITYMLRGDNGASNTDPTAEKKTADNHWIVTGPHIMIVGPAAKSLGLTDAADPDPTKPYLMWPGTPYAHAMVPVGGGAMHSMSPMKPAMKDDMGAMKDEKK